MAYISWSKFARTDGFVRHVYVSSTTWFYVDLIIIRSRCCSHRSVIGLLLRERPRIRQTDLAILQVSKLNPATVRVIKVNPCLCAGTLSQLCWNIGPVFILEKLSQLCWNIEPVFILEKFSQLCWNIEPVFILENLSQLCLNIEPVLLENIDYLSTAGYTNLLTLQYLFCYL